MSRLTNDIHAVRELMGFGSLAIVDALVVIVFSLTLMIAIDPWLTLWSMMAMPLIPVVVRLLRPAYFSLVARDPGSTERHERLHAGELFRHPGRSSLRPGRKSNQRFRSHQLGVPGKDHVAGDAVGDILAAHAGPRRHRRDHRALARRPASIGGHHEPGRIRRFQRLSGDAHLAAHGDRLYRQSISTRHRGVDAHRRSAGYAGRCPLCQCRRLRAGTDRAWRYRAAQFDFLLRRRSSGWTAQY